MHKGRGARGQRRGRTESERGKRAEMQRGRDAEGEGQRGIDIMELREGDTERQRGRGAEVQRSRHAQRYRGIEVDRNIGRTARRQKE